MVEENERNELAEIERWFSERGHRGFGLRFWKDDAGITWADITRLGSGGNVVWPRYGGGPGPIGAAQRARQRYLEEE